MFNGLHVKRPLLLSDF